MKKYLVVLYLMISVTGFCQEWNTDFDIAKSKAATEKKNILLLFTGSDWCGRCTELEKKVWQSPEFKAEAEKHWILLRANFLQKKGVPDPVNVNDMNMILTERYNRNGFFPYIVILDKHGRIIGKTGYEKLDTVKEYIQLFISLEQ